MISNTRYWFLVLFVFLVYIAGMFSILFENDSAQFAVMAMRMFQENDFINLFKGTEEYLDKPHMHYWLAALSFKIFGLHDWAYRIPGILASILGAYSCFGLGKLLYNADVGKLASLIFLTAQTIVLSNIDVRTDAVLTGFTILAIWQLAAYVKSKRLKHIVLGAFAAGIAFSTKGQIAILVIAFPLLCHLAYTRKWKTLLNWKVLIALVVFGLSIAPMLYAYYLQFDLHPEKIIRGTTNRSGIFFIFWEQSFERLSGQGVGKNSSDYFFFFHTFLWVFLPWTVIGLIAYANRAKAIIKLKFKHNPVYEFLTLGGITLIFIIISFAQFKLPHYLNITIPLFAVLAASYLHSLYILDKKKRIKFILGAQYFILSLVFIVSAFIVFFVFKKVAIWHYAIFGSMAVIAIYYSLKRESYYLRIITLAAYSAILLNMVLNLHFYPSLLKYQGGSTMAKVIAKEEISTDNIYKLSEAHTWALDFYNKKPVKIISAEALEDMHSIWVYTTEEERKELREKGFDWDREHEVDQFRITRLQLKFLNNATRNRVLRKRYLIHIY
ncbi:ArnT family glycosyltransferase [Spongiimicrobium salis]|uniref:ArnT family glycosyltransferase n=1 Tax=Spongiimicrobium salis TaxID=1667022 RepID=UPI00374D775F